MRSEAHVIKRDRMTLVAIGYILVMGGLLASALLMSLR